MSEDTIVAISTPPGYGGLGIIRMSGPDALSIAGKIFKPYNPEEARSRGKAVLGHLFNPEDRRPFDEAYMIFFPKPDTYTREDVVEMTCHGSPVILEEVIRLSCQQGARLANPGEFTLRAYFNGRIDILQAEAINDLIQATSFSQAQISFHQMEGRLSKKIHAIRNQFIHLLSQVEARLEFPDEGLHISPKQIRRTIDSALQTISSLVKSYDLGRSLLKGVTLAITGRPNVGKSTLFNALLQQERAVVTPHPGTTRDYIQEQIQIHDAVFTLTDMAGLDKASHPADKESIKKGKKLASESEGILLVLDASRKASPQDTRLINGYLSKTTVLLFNKTDLPRKMDIQKIKAAFPQTPSLDISALKGTHLDTLRERLYEIFIPEKDWSEEVILHLRQKILLEEMEHSLQTARRLQQEGYSEEIYAEEIRKIIPLIGQLSGEIRADDVMNDIFSRFCVGK